MSIKESQKTKLTELEAGLDYQKTLVSERDNCILQLENEITNLRSEVQKGQREIQKAQTAAEQLHEKIAKVRAVTVVCLEGCGSIFAETSRSQHVQNRSI